MNIPNKAHFSINEVCSLLSLKPYVLRFWETEFVEISPDTGPNGERLYRRKDLEALIYIKRLLFDDKLTIEKTKYELRGLLKNKKKKGVDPIREATIKTLPTEDLNKVLAMRNKLKSMISMADEIKNSIAR